MVVKANLQNPEARSLVTYLPVAYSYLLNNTILSIFKVEISRRITILLTFHYVPYAIPIFSNPCRHLPTLGSKSRLTLVPSNETSKYYGTVLNGTQLSLPHSHYRNSTDLYHDTISVTLNRSSLKTVVIQLSRLFLILTCLLTFVAYCVLEML